MKLRCFLILACAALARAEEFEKVPFRVVSIGPIVIDRGERDGLAPGDRILLRPRGGGSYAGVVKDVDERSAVIELDDRRFAPQPGSAGEASVPASRFADVVEEPPPPDPDPDPEPTEPEPETPTYENKDKDWKPGMPLLTGTAPLRPEQRERRMLGLAYAIAAVVADFEGDFDNSFVRAGVDVTVENPFRRGGTLRFNGELDYFTDQGVDTDLQVLLRRLSYVWGGTRFSDQRWEAGRFLQHGMPEFGVLDGVEWTQRRPNGHRWGASVGFMPEPDEDFESFNDLQVAVFYEWVSDPRGQLTFTGGFQKTLHNGAADRDLIVAKVRYLPADGWDAYATVWIDFYTGSDDIKGSGLELTQAIAVVSRRWKSGNGMDVTFQHIAFPQINRNGEFTPIVAAALADNRSDRLSIDGWRLLDDTWRLTGHVTGWNDQDTSGVGGEFGAEARDLFVDGSTIAVSGFAALAKFENTVGGRASFTRHLGDRSWEVLYEIANHHLDGFPADRDDLIQQRVRASWSIHLPTGWDITVHAEGVTWDDELTWSVGFSVSKRF